MRLWREFFVFMVLAGSLCWLGWTIGEPRNWLMASAAEEAGNTIYQAEFFLSGRAFVTGSQRVRDGAKFPVAQMPIKPGPSVPTPAVPPLPPAPRPLPPVKIEAPLPPDALEEQPPGPGPVQQQKPPGIGPPRPTPF